MPFNISEFKSAIEKRGGLARTNIFEVRFSSGTPFGVDNSKKWLSSEFNNRDLRFFCQTVTFPGIRLEVFNHRPNHNDPIQSIPFALGSSELECVFMLDDEHRVMNYMHSWMKRISNYSPASNIGVPVTLASNTLLYELGYKKDYTQYMTIIMYSKSPSPTGMGTVGIGDGYVCALSDVYPVAVGGTTLSWNASNEYGALPVSFSFSSMDVYRMVNGSLETDYIS